MDYIEESINTLRHYCSEMFCDNCKIKNKIHCNGLNCTKMPFTWDKQEVIKNEESKADVLEMTLKEKYLKQFNIVTKRNGSKGIILDDNIVRISDGCGTLCKINDHNDDLTSKILDLYDIVKIEDVNGNVLYETIDFSKLIADAKIYVKMHGDNKWHKAYYAGYDKDTDKILTFPFGQSSFTYNGDMTKLEKWDEVKLYIEE